MVGAAETSSQHRTAIDPSIRSLATRPEDRIGAATSPLNQQKHRSNNRHNLGTRPAKQQRQPIHNGTSFGWRPAAERARRRAGPAPDPDGAQVTAETAVRTRCDVRIAVLTVQELISTQVPRQTADPVATVICASP
ncbi:conserved hypothetical protein [Frankia alni ACN14a]|uniref:Uncharacterized protein n=1 Tax=Frankia alni (strain DSM 45986 / CECT 9034 / ACN14a) TaxID=326424 RepID=Q0RBG0_FRAAA|nr:conserved hypothetical protein [Frankia alni ACN14a]